MEKYKFNRKIFQKPFRYYLRKLFTSWYFWSFIGIGLFFILYPLIFRFNDELWKGDGIIKEATDNIKSENILEIIKGCWSTSKTFLMRLGFLLPALLNFSINNYLVSSKRADDQNILTLATPIRREEVFWAKLAAFGLFFFTANLLVVTLPVFLMGIIAGSFYLLSGFIFLIISAVIAPLLIFLFIASMFFYSRIVLAIISALIFFSSIALQKSNNKEFLDIIGKIIEQPFFLLIIAIPVGFLFYYLYWKKFQKKDF